MDLFWKIFGFCKANESKTIQFISGLIKNINDIKKILFWNETAGYKAVCHTHCIAVIGWF